MRKRSPASAEQAANIVQISASLFARKSYHGTSMRDIGDAVGLLAGSLYAHIDGKEDLLQAIVTTIMERSENDMREVLAMEGSASTKLREIAARDLKLIGENREFAAVFFHEWRNLSPDRQVEVIESRDRWESGLRSIVAQGVEDGEFREVDPRIAGIALTSILNWTYVWYSPDGDLGTAELAEQFADLLITGLRLE